jgi:anti-sigma factor RsiW
MELFAQLSEFIDNELDDEKRKTIQKHIEGCGCCNNCHETLKRTVEICQSMDNVPVPPQFADKLSKLIEAS